MHLKQWIDLWLVLSWHPWPKHTPPCRQLHPPAVVRGRLTPGLPEALSECILCWLTLFPQLQKLRPAQNSSQVSALKAVETSTSTSLCHPQSRLLWAKPSGMKQAPSARHSFTSRTFLGLYSVPKCMGLSEDQLSGGSQPVLPDGDRKFSINFCKLIKLSCRNIQMARTGQNKVHLAEPYRRRKRTPWKVLKTESQSSECWT